MTSSKEKRRQATALAIVAVGAFALALYQDHWYEPVPEFSLGSLSVTGLNVSASSQQITGNWEGRFQIQSKSEKLEYDDLESSILYNGELLSRTVIPDFDQGTRELTVVEAHHSALNAFIGQREAFVSQATVTALAADLVHGSVGFDVRMVGKVNGQRLVVLCGVVPVSVSCNGASGNYNCGPPRACKVRADLEKSYFYSMMLGFAVYVVFLTIFVFYIE